MRLNTLGAWRVRAPDWALWVPGGTADRWRGVRMLRSGRFAQPPGVLWNSGESFEHMFCISA